MSQVRVTNWEIASDNVNVVKIGRSLVVKCPDSVNKQIEMEMKVRRWGPTGFNPLVPILVDSDLGIHC